jgi:putative transposase
MMLAALTEAQAAGASLGAASKLVGLSKRTVERWRLDPDGSDKRRGPRHRPGSGLKPREQAKVIAVMQDPKYVGVSPKQLVPMLADEGSYLASEATMYRLQRRFGLRTPVRRVKRSHVTRSTTMHTATGPNQIWSWDITYLPTPTNGRYFYLYLVLDVWCRRIVGWRVHHRVSHDLAAEMIEQICRAENIDPKGLVLHSDNGTPMRGSSMISTLQWLGIVPSFSRPHVSDDNPYSESLFRTMKYVPAYPRHPFGNIEAANVWVAKFAKWYNTEHRHSAIRFVTPDQRHFGLESAVLTQRRAVYTRARKKNPERWSTTVRNWSPIQSVVLNPERPPAA